MGKHLPVVFLVLLFSVFTALNGAFAQVPVVNSFSPAKGFVGAQVTITGTNFNPLAAGNIVFFGATRANVLSATATTIITEVPAGATFQPLSVLNTANQLTGYSRYPFHVTFASKGTITALDLDAKVDYAGSDGPSSVALADLDGDGKVDMVVANRNSNTISIFKNTATSGFINSSSFAPKFDIATNFSPLYIDIGDLDGDGNPDIAVANNSSNNISIFRNKAIMNSLNATSFEPKVDIPTDSYPYVVKIGDLDLDGKPDIAVGYNYNTAALSVIKNNSTIGSITAASFEPKVDLYSGNGYFSVCIADLNDNGKPDLVMTDIVQNLVSVFNNISTPGTLSMASFATKRNFPASPFPLMCNTGDIDGDGKTDIIISNFGESLGPGQVTGFYLIVLLNRSTPDGNINFGSAKTFASGRVPQSSTVGDIDGDGKLDAITTNYDDQSISIFHNNSIINNASFEPKLDFLTGLDPQSVKMADVDGDGKPDIVVANNQANTISIFRNNASNKLSLTLPVQKPVVYGTPGFSAGATSNSNIAPLNYSSDNPAVATIDASGFVTITGVGTTNLTVSQNGDANHDPAAPQTQALTVTPAPLQIKADDKSRAYGEVNPPLTAAFTGLVYNDTQTSLNLNFDLSTTAVINASPGTYPVVITGNNSPANYTVNYVNGTLTITKIDQSILFDPVGNRTIEDDDFTLSATASSGLPVTFTSSNPEIATVEGNVVKILKIGTVTFTASQPGDDIYNAIAVSRSFTVTSVGVAVKSNTITPNADGINDTWIITGLDFDLRSTVTIFNRLGSAVFQSKGYPVPFNGTRNGKRLPAGVYYYIIAFADSRPALSGSLTIIY